MIDYFFPYWGPFLFRSKIDLDQVNQLNKICVKKQKQICTTKLAGHIKEEYDIDCVKYQEIIAPQLQAFQEGYQNFYNRSCGNLNTVGAWVNYMKAGEYNPPHVHGGCDFSSVIYTQVPEKIKEEMLKYKGTSHGPGTIEFFYGESIKHTNSWYSHLPEKGDIFIFPSTLRHFVSPFKSKKVTRISIAANFESV